MRRRGDLASGLDLLPARTAVERSGGSERARGLLHPGQAALGRRNRLSNFTFFLLAAMGGSAATAVAVVLAGWALISLALRRFPWRWERSDLPIALSTLVFFLVVAGSDLFHAFEAGEPASAARPIGERLLFLLPLFLIPRMRCSRFADTLPPAFFGAAVGGLILIPICALSPNFAYGRVAGFAGNSGPFSIAALLAAGWSLLAISQASNSLQRLVGLAGALGGALAVVSSGMRGAWPALPAVVLLAVLAQRRQLAVLWRRASPPVRVALPATGALVLAICAYVAAPAVGMRIHLFFGDLSQIMAGVDAATSLNLRRAMYEAAAQAIAARPWFGYGENAIWTAIRPYLDGAPFGTFSFSHLHNVFLTVGVVAGLAGIAALLAMVAAPVWTAWAARRAEGGDLRLAAALILVVAFLVPGFTNIMFFHDILDSIWVFATSLVAASVPPRRERVA